MCLKSHLRADRVALILRCREFTNSIDQCIRVVSQEQAAGYRQLTEADHVAIAHVPAEASKAANIDFALETANGRFAERYGETDARVQQETVICKIAKTASV